MIRRANRCLQYPLLSESLPPIQGWGDPAPAAVIIYHSFGVKNGVLAFMWQGRVVPCLLPPGWTGDVLHKNRPLQHMIDPFLLSKESGPMQYRPSKLRPRSSNQISHSSLDGTLAPSEVSVGLYIHQYPGGDNDNGLNGGLHLQMNRDSEESVERTLQRMHVSVNRKVLPKTDRRGRKVDSAGDAASATPTVWSIESNELKQQLDVSSISNREFARMAMTTPLAICLPIAANGSQAPAVVVNLLVESCPPTLLSVRTFEDFEACLFVNVPVLIETDLLYATHARVDWYVNGELKCQDACCYTPDESDVGKVVAVMITPMRETHNGEGCEEAYRFVHAVQALPENTLLTIRSQWLATSPASHHHLRVVTYNILADQNAFQSNSEPCYPYVSKEVLRRQRRLPLIVHEILSYQADIICWQEVDEKMFESLYRPVLQHFKFDGYYTGKAGQGTREGCALFWSRHRFDEVSPSDKLSLIIRELVPDPLARRSTTTTVEDDDDEDVAQWSASMDALTTLLTAHPELHTILGSFLGHVAQMVPLNLRDRTSCHLWVVNTHLYFHPRASHIRLLQMLLLCRWVDKMTKERPGALIFCGDFNSSLSHAAGKLVVDRLVPANFRTLQVDLLLFSLQLDEQQQRQPGLSPDNGANVVVDFPEIRLPDSFPGLVSALSTPAFTHYVQGFSGTLDHILIEADAVRSVREAPMPSVLQVSADTAMPSKNLPSDHVSLVCDIELTK